MDRIKVGNYRKKENCILCLEKSIFKFPPRRKGWLLDIKMIIIVKKKKQFSLLANETQLLACSWNPSAQKLRKEKKEDLSKKKRKKKAIKIQEAAGQVGPGVINSLAKVDGLMGKEWARAAGVIKALTLSNEATLLTSTCWGSKWGRLGHQGHSICLRR